MKCPNCGNEIPEGSGFCGYCGFNLAETQSKASEQAKPLKDKKRSIPQDENRAIAAKEEKTTKRKAVPADGVLTTGKKKLPRWTLPGGMAVIGLAAAALILPILVQPSPKPQPEVRAPQEPSVPQSAELPAGSASEAEPTPDLTAPLPKEISAMLPKAKTKYYSDCSEIDSSFFYTEEFKENVYSEDSMIVTQSEGIITTPTDIIPGNAVLVKFMMKADDETEWMMIGIDAGYQEDYRAMEIAVIPGDFRNVVFNGDPKVYENHTDHRFSGMEEIDPDKWYYSLFTVLEDGRVNLRVWPTANPLEYIERTEDFEIPSPKDTWRYLQHVTGSGIIYLDDFWTLEFEPLK